MWKRGMGSKVRAVRTPQEIQDEARLIERMKRQEPGAFDELYAKHHRQVFSLCLFMTGCVEDAEDRTQETFVNVFRFIGGFNGEAQLSSWIHRIAINMVLMSQPNKRQPEFVPFEIDTEDGGSAVREISVDDRVLRGSIDRKVLEDAIDNLPPECKLALILHDVEGYQHKEIAEMHGIRVRTSKSQLSKARRRMRKLLRGVPVAKGNKT